MKKVYKIVTDISSEHLNQSVSNLLNEGWELVGGLAISVNGPDDDDEKEHLVYGQALVQTISEEKWVTFVF